ncbi:MAG: DNA helicase [Clostridium argentinense]|nr:DNA helicase [Clostridium argentinense]
MERKRVSELITTDEIKQWKDNDIITITAGTGVGKSYFIKNILHAFSKKENKRILFLIHRSNCVKQFQKEIEVDRKADIIDIRTYQSLESLKNNHKKEFDFSDYQYIVCDEFHYFMSDASFNKTTDISLNLILSQKNKIKIFMSATGNTMKNYIENIKKMKTISYELPITYNFIKTLTFFNKDETMEKFIEETIEKDEKGIFFIQSVKKAYELHKRYEKYTLFNCSKFNNKYYKYVNVDRIDRMLQNERFEERILITTTCMDAGVNIKDDKVKHIVCDVKDIGSLIQCIGRKRLQNDNDKIDLYIKTISNEQLGGMKSQLKLKIEMANFLKKHTVREFIEKYPRRNDYNNIVYDDSISEDNKCTKRINELIYYKASLDICDIEIILMYKKYGYCKYLANKFGFTDDTDNGFMYKLIDEEYEKESLEDYLENITSKRLYKQEQEELIEKIDLRVNGRQQKSYSKLNQGLKMLKLQYVILPKKGNSNRYWKIENIDI